jgi:FkbM family methyltransferase
MTGSLKSLIKKSLRAFNFSVTTRINGQRFRVPVIKGTGASNLRSFEPWMADLLSRLFKLAPGSAFADVGMNIGQTLLKVQSLNPGVHYVGFEPNPFCVFYVQELIRKNRVQNCEIIPIGLSDESGLVNFIAESEADTAGSIISNLRSNDDAVQRQHVPVMKFDAISAEVAPDNLQIIKIDVEGAELEALIGMREFLTKQRPYVSCEVLHAHSESHRSMLEERSAHIIELLTAVGYIPFRIIKQEQQRVIGLERIEAFETEIWNPVTSPARCDYLFVPQELVDRALEEFEEFVA